MSALRQQQLTSLVIRQRLIGISMERLQVHRLRLPTISAIRQRLIVTGTETLLVHLQHPPITSVTLPPLTVIVMATRLELQNRIRTISGIPIPPILIGTETPLEPHHHQVSGFHFHHKKLLLAHMSHTLKASLE